MKTVLVPLADGFEEIEAVTIIDILRRAGAAVVSAGLAKRNLTGSHDIHLVADSVLAEELGKNWDAIVLPGGVPGTNNLMDDQRLLDLLKKQSAAGKITAAVCAAPAVLDKAGAIDGREVTIHPTWVDQLNLAQYRGGRVRHDGQIVTGMSAGAVMEFAFSLVEVLFGPAKAAEINAGVLARL
ncbi:MAG: DJ-1 family glyoxalase III [Candidatus Neomarinimicrobiota bacterium]